MFVEVEGVLFFEDGGVYFFGGYFGCGCDCGVDYEVGGDCVIVVGFGEVEEYCGGDGGCV